MTDSTTPATGAWGSPQRPHRVWQLGYGCHHAVLAPPVPQGHHYLVQGYLDVMDACADCKERRIKERAARAARKAARAGAGA